MKRLITRSRFGLVNLYRYHFDYWTEGETEADCWEALLDDFGPFNPPVNRETGLVL
jgi:hypothetical protein